MVDIDGSAAVFILAPFSLILALVCLLRVAGFEQLSEIIVLLLDLVKTWRYGVLATRVIVDSCFLDDHISG